MGSSTITRLQVLGKMRWLVVSAILLAPSAARAQDHDLILRSLSVAPTPVNRTCPNFLSATFLINGDEDHTLAPGAAQIVFTWREAGTSGAWNPIGTLPVTWDMMTDGPFAVSREWPTDFPSAPESTLTWRPPSSPTQFEIRAEVGYSTVTDGNPSDNWKTLTVNSVAGNCSGGCITGGIHPWILCLEDFDKFVFVDPEELLCLLDPDCRPPWPPLCRVVDFCPPCLTGLSCPPEPFRIWIEDPPELFEVRLFDQRERVVARSEPLKRPIKQGDRIFYQALDFVPEKGVEYSVGLKTVKRVAKRPRPLRLRLEAPERLRGRARGSR